MAKPGKKRRSSKPVKAKPMEFLSAEAEHLREKYRTLCNKYAQLVKKFEVQRSDRIAIYSLAKWALQTDSSAIAVVHERTIEVHNEHFRDLARIAGPWRRVGPERESARAFRDLRELVIQEAEPLLRAHREGTNPTWVRRYTRDVGDEILEVRFEHHRATPDGTPRITALVLDVTEHVGTEHALAAARSHLGDNARLRALGELASGMAHDLNNTLGALSLRIELLANDVVCAKAQGDNIDSIRRICADASARVRRLQDFGRRRHDQPLEIIDLGRVIREAIELARPELERVAQLEGIPLDIVAELPELPGVRGDAADLRHVFINLLLNARDAMPSGGRITVTARADGQRIHASVADQGIGIPEAHIDRIFDPFFSTKGQRGTGLGLAIAASVMVRHEGTISARNRPEGGAMIELELPVAPIRRTAVPPKLPAPPVLRHKSVLVIDDDAEHLEATRKVLEQAGQTVTTELSGRAAIERVNKGEKFDIVLCDIGMPDLNGWEVARAISAVSPTTPIFMVSGWANEIDERDPRRKIVAGVLAKPVSLETLYGILGEPGVERAVLLS